jgi:hypothetical protein
LDSHTSAQFAVRRKGHTFADAMVACTAQIFCGYLPCALQDSAPFKRHKQHSAFLVGLITVTSGGTMMSEGIQKKVDVMGIWGALLLGILFAVSFCPTSAAWFFGLLALVFGAEAEAVRAMLTKVGITLPEAALPGSTVILPLIYGIGTAVPVLLVAFLLASQSERHTISCRR